MPVMDASVAVALINIHESEHGNSWAWFESVRSRDQQIAAPTILLAEVAAALSRGMDDRALAHQAVNRMRESELFEWVPVTMAIARRAASLAAEHRIRGCDAIYLALAAQRGTPLVTLDRQQLERAPGSIDVFSPLEALGIGKSSRGVEEE